MTWVSARRADACHLHLEKASGRADLPAGGDADQPDYNWCNEAEEFAPDLKILTLHGPGRAARSPISPRRMSYLLPIRCWCAIRKC